jgi:elongation factor Ts
MPVPSSSTTTTTTPPPMTTVAEALAQTVGRLGEKLVLRRAVAVRVRGGHVAGYVHAGTAVGAATVGRLGVLLAARTAGETDEAAPVLRQVAQQIAGGGPSRLDGEDGLLAQPFLFDPSVTVRAALARAGAASPPHLLSFVRYERGEGLEKRTVDFAADVGAQLRRGPP